MQFMGKPLRHEHKFYLHAYDYLSIRQRVSALLPLDRHSLGPDGYGIRSLYFDGPTDHALHDKVNGVFARDKFRIRIYNGGDKTIKLEQKSKFGNYVHKKSAPLSRSQYDSILRGDYSAIDNSEHPLIREFHIALTHWGYRPITIVDYMREAYIREQGDVRITFDKKLAAGVNGVDLLHPNLVLHEMLDPALTILEIKYNEFLADDIRLAAKPAASNRSSISKYVICRETGMIHFKR
ncbi:polyphosphate polymerase domain-containing protein [Saccharibacillus sp. CPCC 101409]|uniref:polyphosphate polymerase domain-containing protein n=1 Tax=Saccharibacillus sp. CPCC 101409 TaxID=3058041 RepID=UPI002671F276|nr:polyphosphate polymerase domain-containing protein [Saccharibacillus sp. CPCC 101409]MDO3411577.1 polyphosphate polymerase domain-containing protein [Saccharibacillus sp. CPCC 101409]